MDATCEVRSIFGSVHFETDYFMFRLHFLGAIGYFSDLSEQVIKYMPISLVYKECYEVQDIHSLTSP